MIPLATITCDRSGRNWPPGAETQCEMQTGVPMRGTWDLTPMQRLQVCTNDACMSIVAAIRAANPTECIYAPDGSQLYAEFFRQLDSACQASATPAPTPTNTPFATSKPPSITTNKPSRPPIQERVDVNGGSQTQDMMVTPAPSVSQAEVTDPTRRVNATTTPSPSPSPTTSPLRNVTTVVDHANGTSGPVSSTPDATHHDRDASQSPTTNTPRTGDTIITTGAVTSSSSHVGEIIAGLAAGLLATVMLLLWLQKRRSRAKAIIKHTTVYSQTDTTASPVLIEFHSLEEPQLNAFMQLLQPLVDWRVNATAITDLSLLGTGSYGAVYLVKVHKKRLLAAKRLPANAMSSKRLRAMVKEIHLISSLQHPRIVSFVGVAWTTGYDLQVLFEYMERGDLRSYLDRTERQPWTLQKARIALDIAEGLAFVHSFNLPIVHRDLKARNILLGNTMNAKISDFGVARIQSEDGTMTTGIGTSRWLAPEVIRGGGIYTEQCDIYSFGVVLVEMDTHAVPFAEVGGSMSEVMMLMRVADGDLRPELTEGCDPRIAEIVSQCLDVSPSKRPNALELAFSLRQIVKILKNP